jgi:ABC-type bacteriocin/lantibiotic exporter with double-glycine peptidase domain
MREAFATILSAYRVLLRRRQRLVLLGFAVLSLANAAAELVGLGLVLLLLQSFTTDQSKGMLARLAGLGLRIPLGTRYDEQLGLVLLIALAFVARFALAIAHVWMRVAIVGRIQLDLTQRLSGALLYQPFEAYAKIDAGGLLHHLVSTTSAVARGLCNSSMILFTESIVAGLIVLAMTLVEPRVTAATAIALLALYSIANVLTKRRIARNAKLLLDHSAGLNKLLLEGLRGFREVRVMGLEQEVLARSSKLLEDRHKLQRQSRLLIELPRYTIETGVVLFALGLLTTFMIADQPIATAATSLTMISLVIVRLLPLANRMFGAYSQIIDDSPALAEMQRLLAAYPDPSKTRPSTGQTVKFERSIELGGVSVCYPGTEREAISGIGLRIAKGESVGIVGTTGAGKTTLIEVLAGLIEPTVGDLKIDGVALDGSTRTAWRRALGYVAQDVFIFEDTIEANIVCGRPYDQKRLDQAIGAAALQQFIATLPEGLNTRLGTFGDLLSGGQRQRIGIARALYGQPQLLILDEATSALDVVTEAQVLNDIRRLTRGLTRILVTHRLSAIEDCDRVVLVDNGRIKAIGAPEEITHTFRAALEKSA